MAIPVDLEPSRVAPLPLDGRPDGEHATCELLGRLASALPRGRDEQTSLQLELRALLDRLASSSREELDAVHVAAAFLHAPLQAMLDRCAQRGRLQRRDVLELRPIVRSLTCIVDRSAVAPSSAARLP